MMRATRTGVEIVVPSAARMQEVGERLAALLTAGDLVLLTGDLGAGKTTMTQGIGAGLGVRGPITSPTFVIARVHPSLRGGPALLHVDAYRLHSWDEVADLDLEMTMDEAVTVVEWGTGLAEGLSDDRLEITIFRAHGDRVSSRAAGAPDDDPRTLTLRGIGARWADVDLAATLASLNRS